MTKLTLASLGLRVKTGRAIAVLLRGPLEAPVVLKRGEMILTDPKHPDTFEPYHVVLDLPWPAAQKAVRKTASLVIAAGTRAVNEWVGQARESGVKVGGFGIVAGSLQDPSKIGNPHIRAHAAEGKLFREALESGADALGLPRCCFVEDKIYEVGAAELGLSVEALQKRISEMGLTVGRPWRADEKCAAVSAWLALGKLDE